MYLQQDERNIQNGCETWPMATREMRMVRWAMGVSLQERRRNEEMLEEARVEPMVMVMRRLQWYGMEKEKMQ